MGQRSEARLSRVWDLGHGDSTVIIFYQIIGQEVHIIDHYENHGEALVHYVNILKEKPYSYSDHFAPHDIDSKHLNVGLSCKEIGHELGIIQFITQITHAYDLNWKMALKLMRGVFFSSLVRRAALPATNQVS